MNDITYMWNLKYDTKFLLMNVSSTKARTSSLDQS